MSLSAPFPLRWTWTNAAPTNWPPLPQFTSTATSAAWLAMEGWSKSAVKEVIESAIGYDLTTPLDAIRPGYSFLLLASETIPVAIRAVIEGNDFEDVMRLAISMGAMPTRSPLPLAE